MALNTIKFLYSLREDVTLKRNTGLTEKLRSAHCTKTHNKVCLWCSWNICKYVKLNVSTEIHPLSYTTINQTKIRYSEIEENIFNFFLW